jgi:hypothetical protein
LFAISRKVYGGGAWDAARAWARRLTPAYASIMPRLISDKPLPLIEVVQNFLLNYCTSAFDPSQPFALPKALFLSAHTLWFRRSFTGWIETALLQRDASGAAVLTRATAVAFYVMRFSHYENNAHHARAFVGAFSICIFDMERRKLDTILYEPESASNLHAALRAFKYLALRNRASKNVCRNLRFPKWCYANRALLNSALRNVLQNALDNFPATPPPPGKAKPYPGP